LAVWLSGFYDVGDLVSINIYILDFLQESYEVAVVIAHSEYEARHICYNRDINKGIFLKLEFYSNRANSWLDKANCRIFNSDVNGVGFVMSGELEDGTGI
jgi:hypothetical protein